MMGSYTGQITQMAKEKGITRLHFHIEDSENQSISLFNGEVQRVGASRETLMLVEGEYGGFMGSAYVELPPGGQPYGPDEATVSGMIENIIQTASLNREPFVAKPIHDLSPPAETSRPFHGDRLAAEMLAAEKAARQADAVEAFRMGISRHVKAVTLANCEGKSMTDTSSHYDLHMTVMTKDSEKAQTAYFHKLYKDEAPDFSETAAATALDASRMLKSSPYQSGQYKMVIRNDAFGELFGAFLPAFYGERCQNGMSFLKGKAGEVIGSPAFSAYEDPAGVRRFDDEGTLISRKPLVEKGVLADYFHNTGTAAKENRKSNGNGFRQNCNEGISSAYTNVVVAGGDSTLEGLLAAMGEGLLITACDGVFAGVSPVSGDFSVISKGYVVRAGRPAEPISGITIGGSLYDILANLEETANDHMTVNSNTGVVTAPSVRLSGVLVTG